jgi:hypothetical protein
VKNKSWFRKGYSSWNKGLAWSDKAKKKMSLSKIGKHFSPKTEFKSESTIGDSNAKWLGDKVGYHGLHTWVKRKKGKAVVCFECGSTKSTEWANISHEYKRVINDWISLCHKCHIRYDRKTAWGKASKMFDLKKTGRRLCVYL